MSGSDLRLASLLPEAMAQLRAGGLVAYPTETVWGIGANACDEEASERLRHWKGRGGTQPVSILVSSAARLPGLGFAPGPLAQRLIDEFWPGPLTLVLPRSGPGEIGSLATGIARGDGAVGVRCSQHPVSLALAREMEAEGMGPLTSTSLNRSGRPPATTRDAARMLCEQHPGQLFMLNLPGSAGDAGSGEASTVLDLAAEPVQVLRWGGVGRERLLPLLGGQVPSS